MQGGVSTAGDLHDRKRVVTSIGRSFGVHDHAVRLVSQVFAVEIISRGGLRRDIGEEHAPLRLAEMLHARDDFLPRVTALAEAYPAQQIEVCHLRYEPVLRCSGDEGTPLRSS